MHILGANTRLRRWSQWSADRLVYDLAGEYHVGHIVIKVHRTDRVNHIAVVPGIDAVAINLLHVLTQLAHRMMDILSPYAQCDVCR
jgi:hypothetical protein